MIPSVKTWRLTTESGRRFLILAPTRRLAVLNFRNEYRDFSPIRTLRTIKRAIPVGVVMVEPIDSPTHCHCGRRYEATDHCPTCACEQFESDIFRCTSKEKV